MFSVHMHVAAIFITLKKWYGKTSFIKSCSTAPQYVWPTYMDEITRYFDKQTFLYKSYK